MKKYLVAVCFLLLFATLVIAESANKFQLYTERMGFRSEERRVGKECTG
jgi:hypothetical protein